MHDRAPNVELKRFSTGEQEILLFGHLNENLLWIYIYIDV